MTKGLDINQQTSGPYSPAIYSHRDTNITYDGISFEQFKSMLNEKEKEIKSLLHQKGQDTERRRVLKTELTTVKKNYLDLRTAYDKYKKATQSQLDRIDELEGSLPGQLLEKARLSLTTGNVDQADELLEQANLKVSCIFKMQRKLPFSAVV